MGRVQRLVRRHGDVWANPDALPVGLRDRIDRPAGWDPNRKVVGDALYPARMRTTSGRVADDRRALACLQVVAELLGTREGVATGQDIDGLVGTVARPGDLPVGIEVVGAVSRPPVERGEEDGIRS